MRLHVCTHASAAHADLIPSEPEWIEGTNCQGCAHKFGVSTRKHHW